MTVSFCILLKAVSMFNFGVFSRTEIFKFKINTLKYLWMFFSRVICGV